MKCNCEKDKDLYTPISAKIISKRDLTPDVRLFQIVPTEEFSHVEFDYHPGQFMMISLFGVGEAPISISSSPTRKGVMEFAIRKVGRLTSKLFELKHGDIIGLRGPYGKGFNVSQFVGKDIILVAGGLGAAPLRSLLLYILDHREKFGKLYYLYGSKNVSEMLFKQDFFEMFDSDQIELYMIVDKKDDKSQEYVKKSIAANVFSYIDVIEEGLVTQLFRHLKNIDGKNTVAAVCGPPIMYKFVVKELLKYNLTKDNILLSLERRMKCGVGKCGHCVIDYIYTCVDGPVFTYWDVLHMRELI